MPSPTPIRDIKSKLLRPALSSQFEVKIPVPPFMGSNPFGTGGQGDLNLRCSDASLPGSSLATTEIRNMHHGVTEKYAYRRIYDDRIDLTFYVDGANYQTIRFFEMWIDGIVSQDKEQGSSNAGSPNYHYRMRFPKGNTGYKCEQGLEVIKFEKDYKNTLVYKFVDAFPLAISTMPLSYDASSLVKCQVSFNYLRYIVNPLPVPSKSGGQSQATPALNKQLADLFSPDAQAAFNADAFMNAPDLGLDLNITTEFNSAALGEAYSVFKDPAGILRNGFTGEPV